MGVYPLGVLATSGAVAATTGIVATLGAALSKWARGSFRRDEEQERDRLLSEVLGSSGTTEPTVINLGPSSSVMIGSDPDAKSPELTDTAGAVDQLSVTRVDSKNDEALTHNTKFTLLLVDYYAYGLTQARRSFAVSLICSLLGGLVLIAGVALAIIRADTNGTVYAGVVTSVAGVLTTSIGALFHQQANRALKHMEDQTNKLRQDMKAERDADAATELLKEVADEQLRARLQAALILKFSGAKLPDIDVPLYQKGVHLNGDENSHRARSTVTDGSE